jgi:hypothetical protein
MVQKNTKVDMLEFYKVLLYLVSYYQKKKLKGI